MAHRARLAVFLAALLRVWGSAAFPAAAASSSLPAAAAARWSVDYDWSRAGFASGDRAIPRSVGSGRVFDVKRFGAKGNGKTLDDRPVQAALKAAVAAGGGVVLFPRGTYALSKPVLVTTSNIILRGAGRAETTLWFKKSLSQVYGRQFGVDNCTGQPTALWSAGGALVTLMGKAVQTPELARVVVPRGSEVAPGATRLQVDSTEKIEEGQWLQLTIDDTSTAPDPVGECNYGNHTDGGAGAAAGPAGAARPLPAALAAEPIVHLAIQGLAAAGEGRLAVEQGAPPSSAAPGSGGTGNSAGEVQAAMARAGSVAAWVYGENRADSGGPGAINPFTVRIPFVVKRKGPDWVEADRPIPFAIKPGWTAVLWQYGRKVENVGVEDLTIQFRNTGQYEGHFSDHGWNGLQMAYVTNAWVQRVRVQSCDNGVFLYWADHCTVADVEVDAGNRVWSGDHKNVNGHFGISVATSVGALVTRFSVPRRMWHDVSVGTSTILSVFSNGAGGDLDIDHHRAGPWSNLFSNLNMGANTRPFYSGGRSSTRGAHTGRGSAYWNLRAGRGAASAKVQLPDCDFGPFLTFVLPKYSTGSGGKCPRMGWRVSNWSAALPADLHAAQVAQHRQRAAAAP